MPPLVGPERYEDIRKALDTSLGEADLPESIIELDIYLGEAERMVLDRLTVAPVPETNARLINAAVYMTAALLAPAIPQIVSQKDATGETVSLKGYDAAKKEAQMKQRANEMIALVNGTQSLVQRATSALHQRSSCIVILCPRCRYSRADCQCPSTVLVF